MMRHSALHVVAIAALLIPGWAFAQGEPPAQEPAVRLFEALPNGGVIELQRASGDSAGMRTRELPRGGALRISTSDAVARKSIWEFIAFQRNEQMAERPDPR